MKAVVYDGPRQVSVKDVRDALIERPTDALVIVLHPEMAGV
jgi:glutathione-independent formaldehyde dehydrogenase